MFDNKYTNILFALAIFVAAFALTYSKPVQTAMMITKCVKVDLTDGDRYHTCTFEAGILVIEDPVSYEEYLYNLDRLGTTVVRTTDDPRAAKLWLFAMALVLGGALINIIMGVGRKYAVNNSHG